METGGLFKNQIKSVKNKSNGNGWANVEVDVINGFDGVEDGKNARDKTNKCADGEEFESIALPDLDCGF